MTDVTRRSMLAALAAGGLGVAGMGALAGCGAGVLPEPDVAAAGFGQDATGTVQLWTRAATQALSVPIVAAFNRAHRDVKVVLTAIPDTQYITKLATAIRGRSVPDVVDVDDINSTLLAYHEALTDITSLAKPLPYLDQLSPGHLNLATLNNRIYALPYAADTSVLYWNKALLEKAGLDTDTAPTSLAELLPMVAKVNQLGGGVKGISFGGNSPGIMGFTTLPSVWASKDYLFRGDIDNQTINVADNKALQAMLQFYNDCWTKGYATASSRTEGGATWGKDFLAGTVGFWPGSEGVLLGGKISDSFAARVGVAPLPGAVSGTSVFDGGDNIGIPRGAKNASGAWQYIQFALQTSQQGNIPAAGYTPIRSDVLTAAFAKKYPRSAVVLKALPSGYAEKTLAYNTAINQVSSPWFTLVTRAVFSGNVPAALASAQQGFERALTQAET